MHNYSPNPIFFKSEEQCFVPFLSLSFSGIAGKSPAVGIQKPGSFAAIYWLNDRGQISENLKLSYLIKILKKQSHKFLCSPKILGFSKT